MAHGVKVKITATMKLLRAGLCSTRTQFSCRCHDKCTHLCYLSRCIACHAGQMLIKQYGRRRLQELGAHKRRKLPPSQRTEHQQSSIADAARLITDVIQPMCDVIPADSTRGGQGRDHQDVGPFRRPTLNRNGHVRSYLQLSDIRGTYNMHKQCWDNYCVKVINYNY